MREFVVAHEVAHQWWHGLVGSDSRLHPFVDESLAQYSAVLYFEDRYGAARGRASGDRNVRANYQMMRLLGESDGPVDRPVAGSSPISYAGLVYGKGPYYYGALRKQLGSARFFEVLRQYAADHRFGFAGPDDFTALAASRAGSGAAAVHALARRWLHEARGDEDLGKADLAGLLGGLLGGSGSAPSGPHVDAAGINKILQGLGGSDASDAKELEEFLRDFAQ
jgi:aminopeptidase N